MEGALDLPGDSARPAVTMALWAPETGEAAVGRRVGMGRGDRGEEQSRWVVLCYLRCVACDESRSDGRTVPLLLLTS